MGWASVEGTEPCATNPGPQRVGAVCQGGRGRQEPGVCRAARADLTGRKTLPRCTVPPRANRGMSARRCCPMWPDACGFEPRRDDHFRRSETGRQASRAWTAGWTCGGVERHASGFRGRGFDTRPPGHRQGNRGHAYPGRVQDLPLMQHSRPREPGCGESRLAPVRCFRFRGPRVRA